MSFTKEDVPDKDHLFYRIHKTDFNRNGEIIPGAFKERGEGERRGMSTNWCSYSTPHELRDVASNPIENAVVSLHVGSTRQIGSLEVTHDPIPENRSHTHILGIPRKGQLKVRIGLKLLELSKMVLPIKNHEL